MLARSAARRIRSGKHARKGRWAPHVVRVCRCHARRRYKEGQEGSLQAQHRRTAQRPGSGRQGESRGLRGQEQISAEHRRQRKGALCPSLLLAARAFGIFSSIDDYHTQHLPVRTTRQLLHPAHLGPAHRDDGHGTGKRHPRKSSADAETHTAHFKGARTGKELRSFAKEKRLQQVRSEWSAPHHGVRGVSNLMRLLHTNLDTPPGPLSRVWFRVSGLTLPLWRSPKF